MKYLEIKGSMPVFDKLTLEFVLLKIRAFASSYSWSIQLIEAVGYVESVIGMQIVDLEEYCNKSTKGYITDFETIIALARACDDIVDVLIVGCQKEDNIPKAFRDSNWENQCDVIISREDSSLWQLYSNDKRISNEFYSLIND